MGSSGKHRPKKTSFRTILIASGAAVSALAVGGGAFLYAGGSSGASTESSAGTAARPQTVTTPSAERSPVKASRDRDRTPVTSPTPKHPHTTKMPERSAPAKAPARASAPAKAPAKKSAPAVQRPRKKASAPRVLRSGSCEASFYSEGQATASGESFNPSALTAAHKSLPMNSRVRVINADNGRSVVVRINDRGPFVSGRCIDLSRAAMAKVGGIGSGVIPVKYQVLARD